MIEMLAERIERNKNMVFGTRYPNTLLLSNNPRKICFFFLLLCFASFFLHTSSKSCAMKKSLRKLCVSCCVRSNVRCRTRVRPVFINAKTLGIFATQPKFIYNMAICRWRYGNRESGLWAYVRLRTLSLLCVLCGATGGGWANLGEGG